jgi:hypothetical protein
MTIRAFYRLESVGYERCGKYEGWQYEYMKDGQL